MVTTPDVSEVKCKKCGRVFLVGDGFANTLVTHWRIKHASEFRAINATLAGLDVVLKGLEVAAEYGRSQGGNLD